MGTYKQIDKELLKEVYTTAHPVECMDKWGAQGRNLTYLGSDLTQQHVLYDFFRDTSGDNWYSKRAIINGEIVGMDVFLFGHENKNWRNSYEYKRLQAIY